MIEIPNGLPATGSAEFSRHRENAAQAQPRPNQKPSALAGNNVVFGTGSGYSEFNDAD